MAKFEESRIRISEMSQSLRRLMI